MTTPRIVQLGPNRFKQLFARRAVSLFTPNDDGSDSANGKIEWHTEWWFFVDGVRLAEPERGPIFERSIAELLALPIGTIADKSRQVYGYEMLTLNKQLFEMVADADLAPPAPPELPMLPSPVPDQLENPDGAIAA